MTYIRLLVLSFLVFHSSNYKVKAFLPVPEIDVSDVLSARHFAKFTYSHAQHNGICANTEYMGQEWPTYPFRLNNIEYDTLYARETFRNERKLIISFRGSITCFNWWKNLAQPHQRNAACIELSGYLHTEFSKILESVLQSYHTNSQRAKNCPNIFVQQTSTQTSDHVTTQTNVRENARLSVLDTVD